MKNTLAFISIIILISFAVNVSGYRIPDTGQTNCYGNEKEIPCPRSGEPFYGQDASYTINPMSFTKLDAQGNELPKYADIWTMVRDNNTGLIWEVKTNDDSIHDRDNEYNWKETQKVPEKLNAEKFGGYSDWRLPTRQELQLIVNYGSSSPSIDTTYFPQTLSSFYWSSDTCSWLSDSAWGVDFKGGRDNFCAKSDLWHVRAVHDGQK